MMGNGKIINQMDMVYLNILMEIDMKVIIRIMLKMDMENIFMKMVIDMKGNI